MKSTNKLTLALFSMIGTAGHAQSQNPYDGTWKATWTGRIPLEARVVIKGVEGSWQTLARNPGNPCVGLQAPITVTESTAGALNFTARFSDVIPKCDNFDVQLKPDGAILKGMRGGLAMEMRKD